MKIFKEIMKMESTNFLRICIKQIETATKQCASKQLM